MVIEGSVNFCKALAGLCVVVGGVGSLTCLPFAMSSNMEWIAVAGIYFVAGAVMITGGLFTYTFLIKEAK